MILKPRSFLVGRPIIGLGKISYSAYIMHFFVIRFSEDWFRVNITRWTDSAELQLGCYILFTMVFTILASTLLYWAVELPGQALGKRICKLGLPVTV
jgi:peptidoglycan/LPS O-acetylase OafA/YrhL